MKKVWPWIIGFVIVLCIGAVAVMGFGLLRTRSMPMFWRDGITRNWSDNFRHPGITGFRVGFPVVSFLGLFLMIGLPLGLLGLVVLGIVLLVRALRKPTTKPAAAVEGFHTEELHCDNCGKPVDSDWQVCPYCGEQLGEPPVEA